MQHSTPPFTIATMTRAQVALAMDWAAQEGWNPGRHDAEIFHATDPHGFFIGLLDGVPIATISAVAYDDAFGFIGCFIVAPAYRGRWYGIRLGHAAQAYLGARNVGLDGVLDKVPHYAALGYRYAHQHIRYGGTGGGTPPAGTCPLAAVPFADVLAYDRRHFPAPRPQFLRPWITQPDGAALGVYDGRTLAGYGVLRPCRAGYKIGPLFADTPEIADRLLTALRARVPGAAVFLDAPEANPAATALAQRHGMAPVFATARMYSQEAPDLPIERIFGITTFELG